MQRALEKLGNLTKRREQLSACSELRILINHEKKALEAIELGILDSLLGTFQKFKDVLKVQQSALSLLWKLCIYKESRVIVLNSDHNFPAIILETMKTHQKNSKAISYGLSALNEFETMYSFARLGYLSFFLTLLHKVDKGTTMLLLKALRKLLKCESNACLFDTKRACNDIVIVILRYQSNFSSDTEKDKPSKDQGTVIFLKESLNLLITMAKHDFLKERLIKAQVNSILISLYYSNRLMKIIDKDYLLIRCLRCMMCLSNEQIVEQYMNIDIPLDIVSRLKFLSSKTVSDKDAPTRDDLIVICLNALVEFGEVNYEAIVSIYEVLPPVIGTLKMLFKKHRQICPLLDKLNNLMNMNKV